MIDETNVALYVQKKVDEIIKWKIVDEIITWEINRLQRLISEAETEEEKGKYSYAIVEMENLLRTVRRAIKTD